MIDFGALTKEQRDQLGESIVKAVQALPDEQRSALLEPFLADMKAMFGPAVEDILERLVPALALPERIANALERIAEGAPRVAPKDEVAA